MLETSVKALDAIVDDGNLHLFITQQFRQLLQIRLREADRLRLPVRSKLSKGS